MAANQTSLENQAELIRDETIQFANTPLRVGTWMRELITWIVSQFATKVPITVPVAVADSASVVYACGSTDNKKLNHPSATANTAVSITGLKDGHSCQVLPLTIATIATYTYTFTAIDPSGLVTLTCRVLGASGNVMQIVNQATNRDYEILIQRSGNKVYIIQLNNY
jgi:hypothetical protein